MRRVMAIAGAAVVTGAIVGFAPMVQAFSESPGADLAVSGFVAGGVRYADGSHPVVFVFKLSNNGPHAADAAQTYTSVSNGTVTDQECITSDGGTFNPDSPSCEYGPEFPSGRAAHMTLIVQPDAKPSGPRLSVRVCSSNLSGDPDPVSDNNCITKRVNLP